jgi:hypothetical protein
MPTYSFGTDFISVTAEVRRLARNRIPEDFTDAEIQSYQYKVYSIIRTLTDKDDWATTDREYGALQLIETSLAAEMIKKHFAKTDQDSALADSNISSWFLSLKEIVDNLDTVISASTNKIRKTTYKSWILNPDVPVPRRGLTIT